MFRTTLILSGLLLVTGVAPVRPAEPAARYSVPANLAELRQRVGQLRNAYAPYLRSLPAKAKSRRRDSLCGTWRFTFEVKDPPRDTTSVPPAPDWYRADFNDHSWQTTTVPEWRYRTRGHDNAYDTKIVDKWLGYQGDRTTSQICWYRREFTVDKPTDGHRLWLCFDGVDWEAQVYLNGKLLGSHQVYYEPFRFDVTDRVNGGKNTLAVRVIDGREYGEPMTYWATFPDIRATKQRYTPDRSDSIPGNLPLGYHGGTGFGIWRDVYLEKTGPVRIDRVLVRNSLSKPSARIRIALDNAAARPTKLHVSIMPENCAGRTYEKTVAVELPAGASMQEITVPMPDAKVWSPDTPNLYRCRVTVAGDVKDALFGCRSFTLVQRRNAAPVYTFNPVKARWLRIVGHGSDQTSWNSIWEVQSPALVRDPKTVTASKPNKSYPARFAIDGKLGTRWAVNGEAWIQLKLDPNRTFDHVMIDWYQAFRRKWKFDLLVSTDGKQWKKLVYRQAESKITRGLPAGMFLLNGKPCYLRGTNIQGLNAYAYWGQTDSLIDAILLLKAGYFNAVRACQHVQMPEVREMLDRLGIMSQQDQGGGYHGSLPTGIRGPQHVHAAAVLTRVTYNNPGVVLLCFGNEHEFPTAQLVRAGLAIDPERIYKPISGRFTHSRKRWDLPLDLRANAIDDGHPYTGWYGGIKPQTWGYASPLAAIVDGGRMVTLGEFGAEAMDAYATMKTYPPQFAPPPAGTDTLWACSQVEKHDIRQRIGLGRDPTNLGEYIEASQNYQESLLADRIIQMRLLPHGVAGYFQFHFIDVVPVFWPKSIVSHDHRPKKAYYQVAQINQPVVVLPRLAGARPDTMTLWVCNDLDTPLDRATVSWSVRHGGETLLHGRKQVDVMPINATRVETIDLMPITGRFNECDLEFVLTDTAGVIVSRYQRHLRCVPRQLLHKQKAK